MATNKAQIHRGAKFWNSHESKECNRVTIVLPVWPFARNRLRCCFSSCVVPVAVQTDPPVSWSFGAVASELNPRDTPRITVSPTFGILASEILWVHVRLQCARLATWSNHTEWNLPSEWVRQAQWVSTHHWLQRWSHWLLPRHWSHWLLPRSLNSNLQTLSWNHNLKLPKSLNWNHRFVDNLLWARA